MLDHIGVAAERALPGYCFRIQHQPKTKSRTIKANMNLLQGFRYCEERRNLCDNIVHQFPLSKRAECVIISSLSANDLGKNFAFGRSQSRFTGEKDNFGFAIGAAIPLYIRSEAEMERVHPRSEYPHPLPRSSSSLFGS